METFDQFETQALAEKRIDFDNVDGYQCVDLILQGVYLTTGIRGERGNAIDYWNDPTPVLLTRYTKLATQAVQRGDIVVLNGLTGNPYGHVMWGTGNSTATTFEGLEQNGGTGGGSGTGTDAIRTRYVDKSRIAGVLRPTENVTPAAAPVSAAPAAPSSETYDVVVSLNGYVTANDAANHEGTAVAVATGNYNIFNEYKGMINVTHKAGVAGDWINPGDNNAPVIAAPAAAPAAAAPSGGSDYDGNSITIQPGWGLSNAAQAAGFPDYNLPTRWQLIAEANGSSDWQTFNAGLKAGERIVVGKYVAPTSDPTPPAPAAPAPAAQSNIVYTKLDSVISLVTKQNPTHVWMLNFANDTEAVASFDMPQGASFMAYGKAQRTDGDKPCYYMSQSDFGDADTTGTPVNDRGINTVDLAAAPAETATTTPAAQEASSATPAIEEDAGEKVEVKVLPPNLDTKYMYTKFLSPQKYTAVKLDTAIKELQGLTNADGSLVHPDQQLVPTQPITLAGTLIDPETKAEGYRSIGSANNGLYYFVPKADVKPSSLLKDASEVEKFFLRFKHNKKGSK
jgi:hypothetical protein